MAGEYYVAYKLSTMGYVVGLPHGNSPGVDLLVSNQDGSKQLAIQVKTQNYAWGPRKKKPEESHWDWDLSAKNKRLNSDKIFYAFVDLRDNKKEPLVFIVPSRTVYKNAKWDSKRITYWVFIGDKDKYCNRWDYIEKELE